MAYEVATATSHVDFCRRLMSFLLTNSALVTANQEWEYLGYGVLSMRIPGDARVSFANRFNCLDTDRVGTTATISPSLLPAELYFEFVQARNFNGFIVRIGTTAADSPAAFSFDWSDDGTTWTTVQSWSGITWTASEEKTFTFNTPPAAPHRFWRFRVTAGNSANSVAIADFDGVAPGGARAVIDSLVTLRGPGLSGDDEILVTFDLATSWSIASDYYNVGIGALSTRNPVVRVAEQANRLSSRYVLLWDQAMPYWLVANGRRFYFGVRVSTVYESAYAGFINPFHLPTTWPYPLFVGASEPDSTDRWSIVRGDHTAFFVPNAAAMYFPDGVWRSIQSRVNGVGNADGWSDTNVILPWHRYDYSTDYRENLDGTYPLSPAIINVTSPFRAVMGTLDGIFWTTGFNNSSETILTVSGVNYVVIQNVFRTTAGEYAAFRLE